MNKPNIISRLIISVSLMIIFLIMFSLIYSSSVNIRPYNLLSDFTNKTFEYASNESKSELFYDFRTKCDSASEMLNLVGMSYNNSEVELIAKLKQTGIKDEEINLFLELYNQCKKTQFEEETFYELVISDLLIELNIDENTTNLNLIENIESLDMINTTFNENINFEKSFKIINLFNQKIKLIGIILILLTLVIFLSYDKWYYLLNKVDKSFIQLGITFITPYFLIKIFLGDKSKDTSLVFESISQIIQNPNNVAIEELIKQLQYPFIIILSEILYPFNLVVIGLIILLISLILLIILKRYKSIFEKNDSE